MAKIALGGKRGQGLFALVNDDIAEIVGRFHWYLSGDMHVHGYTGRPPYIGSKHTVPLGRFVYQLLYGFSLDRKDYIDHIDRNPLNNLDSNLRRATMSVNIANGPKRPSNTSGFKGVFWSTQQNKWAAKLRKNYRQIHLGYHVVKADAARAVNAGYRVYYPGTPLPNPSVEGNAT